MTKERFFIFKNFSLPFEKKVVVSDEMIDL
jgi:hypothetical protein